MQRWPKFTLIVFALFASGLSGCSDPGGPRNASVTSVTITTGNGQSAFAGTPLSGPIVVIPRDANGAVVKGQIATFLVSAGGGSVSVKEVPANPDGSITAPVWTLGKSSVPQTLDVKIGSVTTVIDATVKSDFAIEIRFFGAAPTPAQQAFVTDAAARIQGAIVGALPAADLGGITGPVCGDARIPTPQGTTTGALIFAEVRVFDGLNGFLGASQRCFHRSETDARTAIGLVALDVADVNLSPARMKVVSLHEMLHALGFGIQWNEAGLLNGYNSADVTYTGPNGIAGCRLVGGTTTCANSVPVESMGGPGTANGHWRSSVFGPELMTGFYQADPAFSAMSIRSMEDLNYTVNTAAADSYTIPSGSLRQSNAAATDLSERVRLGGSRPLPKSH